MSIDRKSHWNAVYGEKTEGQLSWHQDDPEISLELIELTGVSTESPIIDIGGGTSRLASALLAKGYQDVSVLDLSDVALEAARGRLGSGGDAVAWIAADITKWSPDRRYDLWHDRAVFHFLVDASEQAAYQERLAEGLRVGGHAIVATFAPDGPATCSGLSVVRYSSDALADLLGDRFKLVAHRNHLHQTPWGKGQAFQFSVFRRAS